MQVDPAVIVGYPAGPGAPAPLVLGAGARLRSGTTLYRGTIIGNCGPAMASSSEKTA